MIYEKAKQAYETWHNLRKTAEQITPKQVFVETEDIGLAFTPRERPDRVHIHIRGGVVSDHFCIGITQLEDLIKVVRTFLHGDPACLPEGTSMREV